MKITLAHLYYDLLNLYGESGNVKALINGFKQQNIKIDIKLLSINDKLEFDKYDIIYIGAGTEHNQSLVLKHIMKYKKDIKKYIDSNKFFIATGNSIDLFGKCMNNEKCLNIFDFITQKADKRIVEETLVKCNFLKNNLIGFQNQSNEIINTVENPLFEIINSTSKIKFKNEGIKYNNFYATYLLGPILIRNSELLKYIITNLITSKNKNFKFKKFNFTLENRAFKTYVSNKYN